MQEGFDIESVLEKIGLDADGLTGLDEYIKSFSSPAEYVSSFFHYFPIGYSNGLFGRSALPFLAPGSMESNNEFTELANTILKQHEICTWFYMLGNNLGNYVREQSLPQYDNGIFKHVIKRVLEPVVGVDGAEYFSQWRIGRWRSGVESKNETKH